MTSYCTGLNEIKLQSVGLVDAMEDDARAKFSAACTRHPVDSYPGFELVELALASSVVVKSWGRRPFKLDTRCLKSCISDSMFSMTQGTANFTKRPLRTRATIWCAPKPGHAIPRSCEVVCCVRLYVKETAAMDGPSYYYDCLFVQWHVPVRTALEGPLTAMKPSRVVPGFWENPVHDDRGVVVDTEEEPNAVEEAVASEWDFVCREGSLALAGGAVRQPVDAYHANVPADVVALGMVTELVPLSCVVGRADCVPCVGGEDLYGSVPGPHQVPRPPFFRMYPRV